MDADEVDLRILAAIQDDCKQPLARIGDEVGLTAPSVMERVRKLEQAGVVRGYHAHLDGQKLGLDVTAFVGVAINFPKSVGSIEEQIAGMPEVMECHHVTGGQTLLLKVRVRNTLGLEELIGRLRMIEYVERTETMVVLSTITERPTVHLPIPDNGAAAPTRRRRRR